MTRPNWKEIAQKLHNKYRLVILNDTTLEEKVTMRLSRMNVYIVASTIAVLLILLTVFIIILTPIKEYIPGYNQDTSIRRKVIKLNARSDSLERIIIAQEKFINSFKHIFSPEIPQDQKLIGQKEDAPKPHLDSIYLDAKSSEDSLLRQEIEKNEFYTLYSGKKTTKKPISQFNFIVPVEGIVTNHYDFDTNHFGIDIVAKENEAIRAIADGSVIFSDYTLDTGYVIAILHDQNLVSVYKHNSANLKKEGNFVVAGDAIAIIGNSGEQSWGPHLHFELWHKAAPTDPQNFINFE